MRISSLHYWGLLALPLLCVACSKPKAVPVVNAADGWVYALPPGFVKRSVNLPKFVQQFVGPMEEGNQVNIVIESLPGKETAEQVGKAVAKNPGSDVIVQEQSPYDLPGVDAYTVRVTRNKGVQGQRQIYLTHDGVCVIFTLTSGIKTFDQWDQTLKDSLESFHWTKKAATKSNAT